MTVDQEKRCCVSCELRLEAKIIFTQMRLLTEICMYVGARHRVPPNKQELTSM